MNAFLKTRASSYRPAGSPRLTISFKPTQVTDGQSVVNTIERVVQSPDELAKTLVLPTAEEYSLARILATGQTPAEVTTRGLIRTDELPSTDNIHALIDRITDLQQESQPATTQPAVENATSEESAI